MVWKKHEKAISGFKFRFILDSHRLNFGGEYLYFEIPTRWAPTSYKRSDIGPL